MRCGANKGMRPFYVRHIPTPFGRADVWFSLPGGSA
jgi:hypothetical protein